MFNPNRLKSQSKLPLLDLILLPSLLAVLLLLPTLLDIFVERTESKLFFVWILSPLLPETPALWFELELFPKREFGRFSTLFISKFELCVPLKFRFLPFDWYVLCFVRRLWFFVWPEPLWLLVCVLPWFVLFDCWANGVWVNFGDSCFTSLYVLCPVNDDRWFAVTSRKGFIFTTFLWFFFTICFFITSVLKSRNEVQVMWFSPNFSMCQFACVCNYF